LKTEVTGRSMYPKMSCIFKLFSSGKKKNAVERKPSFILKMSDPIPKTYEELVQYEAFLRGHMSRLNRRFETVSKNLLYVRSQGNTMLILSTMKERQELEIQFEAMKKRLREVVKKRAEFEGNTPLTPRTPTLMLEVVPNPLVSK
jgi:hypothetical protein